jgi:hypothetical protein
VDDLDADCSLPQEERTFYQPLVGMRATGVIALLCPTDLKRPNQGRSDGAAVNVFGYPERERNQVNGKPNNYWYNRTHILADRFGGLWIPENLFPGYALMNTSGMKRCENRMATQLSGGVPVLYSGQVSYYDPGPRPGGIQMTAFTPAGELFNAFVRNIPTSQETC